MSDFARLDLREGCCKELLRTLPDECMDSCVTDPPYELGFMGRGWDRTGIAYEVGMWAEVLRVLKPGAHLLAFGGTRTHHRMVCAIEDAGFAIRDEMQWLYGSGFPKSLDVGKAIDRAAGHDRTIGVNERVASQAAGFRVRPAGTESLPPVTEEAERWQGWGTALKPACEPICVARKPFSGTVAANVLEYGTGALNVDGCRVGMPVGDTKVGGFGNGKVGFSHPDGGRGVEWQESTQGRWPANVLHDASAEVLAAFGEFGESKSGGFAASRPMNLDTAAPVKNSKVKTEWRGVADSGSAARFFQCCPFTEGEAAGLRFYYAAKAGPGERAGNAHPTVKPLSLLRYLVRLVTPPGGRVLDGFAGSGTTALAALLEGFACTALEQERAYVEIIRRRTSAVQLGLGL